jgi:hypothetical protein
VAGHFADGGNDMDALTFTVSGLPAGLDFDPATGLISGVTEAGSGQIAPYRVVLIADDGQGGVATDSFGLSVSAPADYIEDSILDELSDSTDEPEDLFDVIGTGDEDVSINDQLTEDLNGTAALDQGSGVLLSAFGSISTFSNVTLETPSLGASEQGVVGADDFAGAGDLGAAAGAASPYNSDAPETFDFNTFIEEKELRDQGSYDPRLDKFFIEVLNRHDVAFLEFKHSLDALRDGTIVRVAITQADGGPLPEWMKLVREGFISAKLPIQDETVDLKITVMLGSGNELSKPISVEVVNQQARVLDAVDSEAIAQGEENTKASEKLSRSVEVLETESPE